MTAPRRSAAVSSMKMSSRLAPDTSIRSTRPSAAEMRDEIEHASFLLAHGDERRVLRRLPREAGGMRAIALLEQFGQRRECHRDLIEPARQQLQRIDVAARRLTPGAHDENVVAELFGLAENLRRQHDRAAARGFLPQARHDRSLQDRIHPGRELIEEHDRRIDHEDLRHLHAPLEAAAQVHHLPMRLRSGARTGPARRPFDRGSRSATNREISRTCRNCRSPTETDRRRSPE